MEDELIGKEDKRKITRRLEERSFEVQKLTNNQPNMINQLVISNQEANRKDVEIINLKLQGMKRNSWKEGEN